MTTLQTIIDPCGRSIYRMARSHFVPAIQAAANARSHAEAKARAGTVGWTLLDALQSSSAYADGADGSTHEERIEDMRRAASDLDWIDEDDEADGQRTDIDAGRITLDDYDRLADAIDAVETWHYAAGSLSAHPLSLVCLPIWQ
jgi:hypothetical protein